MNNLARPFIRQAGGKRKLVPLILPHLPPPDRLDLYVEPFLGGGALFLHLASTGYLDHAFSLVGDACPNLSALWQAVQQAPEALLEEVNPLIAMAEHEPEGWFLNQRRLWNEAPELRTPARHLFLRRAAFNGLWRTNRAGQFNTPWKKVTPSPYAPEDILSVSRLLDARVSVLDWDFRQYDSEPDVFIGPRTVVYLDPPYLPQTPGDFVGYTENRWTRDDMRDLVQLAATWSRRGARVILSHSDHPEVRDLVDELWPDAGLVLIYAARMINSDGAGRGPVPELLVVGGG